jgi:sugar phosphate isomerase/epimerase
MFSLSTSWNSQLHSRGVKIVEEIKAAGFDSIELGFSLTRDVVEELLTLKEKGLIQVSSLHNICPLPAGVEPDEASPDYYSLASLDEEERALAVDAAKNTISYAERFGARAVVLHTGRVPIKDRTKELALAFHDRKRCEKIVNDMERERREKRDAYVGNVIRSLEELVPAARDAGVKLGIENRYSYCEIPLLDEFERIFHEVKEAWYWHDVGHAEAFERLGLARHRDLLQNLSHRLIGIHLHDIIDLMYDHQAPLYGTFDFRTLIPYVKRDTIKVIEAHQPATADEIRKGCEYLKTIFGG